MIHTQRFNSAYFHFLDTSNSSYKNYVLAKNGLTIQYIKNPSKKECKLAINQNPCSISYIKNQTEELQKFAIKKYPYAIRDISNPSIALQKIAVTLAYNSIAFIKNPSKEIQLIITQQRNNMDPTTLLFLDEVISFDWCCLELLVYINDISNNYEIKQKIKSHKNWKNSAQRILDQFNTII